MMPFPRHASFRARLMGNETNQAASIFQHKGRGLCVGRSIVRLIRGGRMTWYDVGTDRQPEQVGDQLENRTVSTTPLRRCALRWKSCLGL